MHGSDEADDEYGHDADRRETTRRFSRASSSMDPGAGVQPLTASRHSLIGSPIALLTASILQAAGSGIWKTGVSHKTASFISRLILSLVIDTDDRSVVIPRSLIETILRRVDRFLSWARKEKSV